MSANDFYLIRLMFDYVHFGLEYEAHQHIYKYLSERKIPDVYYPWIDNWSIGDHILFNDRNVGIHFCFNGGNMRPTFWREILPQLSENMLGSIIFICADSPSSFRQLRWILNHDYIYDASTGYWGKCFMSPPFIAFANTSSPNAWELEDIKLYLRDYPDLHFTTFEPDSFESVRKLVTEALEHCASYILD